MGFFSAKGDRISGHIVSPLKVKHTFYDQILQSFNDLLSNMFGGNFKIPSPSFNWPKESWCKIIKYQGDLKHYLSSTRQCL